MLDNPYFLRWGIETTYDTLKNKLLLEKFAGRSHVAVLQEYYAMMFVLNCIAAMSAAVNRKLVSSKADCKYRYRANVNLMIGYFKYRLRKRIKALEKENRRLSEMNEFLEDAAAFFAASRQKSGKNKD